MAAITSAVVIGGASLYGANQAKKAANKQAASYDAATAEQARQFDIMQEAQAPYQQVGSAALNQLAALYGLPQYSDRKPLSFEEWQAQNSPGFTGDFPGGIGNAIFNGFSSVAGQLGYQKYLEKFDDQEQTAGGGAAAPDYSNFFASPDYQFALKQGLDATQNSAAARGGLYSGNALRGITEYGQGMASQQLNNYANRLAGIAGVGQTAASAVGQGALQTGANIGNLLVGQGNARASGIAGQANALTNGVNQFAMLYGMGAFGGSPFGAGGSNAMAMNYNGPLYGGGLA